MTVVELSQNEILSSPSTNEAPFVFKYQIYVHTTAAYWIDVFDCPDETINIPAIILSIIQDITIGYAQMYSLEDCIATESSWFYDPVSTLMYIHYDHDVLGLTEAFEIGTAIGFTDKDVIYIDDVEYSPLILSVPSMAKQQDLVNYDKLSMVTGSVVLKNVGAELDYLITRKIYGNDLKIYRLDVIEGITDYQRSALVGLACAYVDDYDIDEEKIDIKIGDKRDSNDISIPTDTFTVTDYPDIEEGYIGEVIPVAYGLIRRSKVIPVNGDGAGDVTFRQALILTSLGTVEVKIDEAWMTKVPTSTSLATGSFILADADARNASDIPYECRVTGSVGIPALYASDIIVDMNDRYLGIEYLASTYDTTEWELEEVKLTTAGLLLNEKKKMFEWIAYIQGAVNVGFRYDILPDGRRTIRADDFEREEAWVISPEDILNINTLSVSSEKELLLAKAIVKYAQDYNAETFLSITDDSQEAYVLQSYRKQPELETETILTLESDAEDRGAWQTDRFKDVPKVVEAIVFGPGWDSVRIFDIVKIAITPAEVDMARNAIGEGREYYGIWKGIVIGINPSLENIQNTLSVRLIEKYQEISTILMTEDGAVFLTADGCKIVIEE
jgi:hypothetical protein